MSKNHKPNIHIGMIGKPSKASMSLAALSSLAAMPCSQEEESTSFSKLSAEARKFIVNAMVGEYDNAPPEIPESVKAEIAEWAYAPDDENDQVEARDQ